VAQLAAPTTPCLPRRCASHTCCKCSHHHMHWSLQSCDATMSHEGALAQFQLMQEGIAASGRAQYFSLCGWLKWYAGR